MKHIDRDVLRAKIAADPDLPCEAGVPPTPAASGGTERCATCGGPAMRCECCTTPGFDTPPASAPGSGEDVPENVFAAIGFLSGTASAYGRGNATFANVEAAAQAAFTEILAAVARARAEGEAKGRRQALAWMYRCRYPHLDELRIAERVMCDLAALADDEGRGK